MGSVAIFTSPSIQHCTIQHKTTHYGWRFIKFPPLKGNMQSLWLSMKTSMSSWMRHVLIMLPGQQSSHWEHRSIVQWHKSYPKRGSLQHPALQMSIPVYWSSGIVRSYLHDGWKRLMAISALSHHSVRNLKKCIILHACSQFHIHSLVSLEGHMLSVVHLCE